MEPLEATRFSVSRGESLAPLRWPFLIFDWRPGSEKMSSEDRFSKLSVKASHDLCEDTGTVSWAMLSSHTSPPDAGESDHLGNRQCAIWQMGMRVSGQGPWRSKKYIYWGQCSQLGHRSSCLHWPKANKSGVKKDAISRHDWVKYIIPLLWIMMDAPHWRGSIAKVRDRVSGSAWIPVRAKPAQQSNKVKTVSPAKG